MITDQIALLFQAGDITQATVTRAPLREGKWTVQFERKSTKEIIPLTARRNNIRHFASADSAIKILNDLGMKNASIDWS